MCIWKATVQHKIPVHILYAYIVYIANEEEHLYRCEIHYRAKVK